MSPEELRALYDQDQRINFEEPGVRREVTAHTVRQINLNEPESFLLYSKLTSENADQVIDSEIAYFESIGHNFEWKLYTHDTPSDLVERLRRRGFEIDDPETILVLDMEGLTGILTQPVTHDIRRITDPAEVKPLIDVQAAIYGHPMDGMVKRITWELTHYPDYISFYGAYVDNQPVASARMYLPAHSQFASLWGGGTLDVYRGRGIYTALLAARVQEAIQRGRRFLTLDASPMSRPIVEKLGFVPISISMPCTWESKAALKT
jgi:GNAT superfamily N-acetyltransferase